MWTPPNLLNRWRSSSDGSNTPLGWEGTVPTTEKSGGSMWSWKIACRFPPIVPGTRRSSVITPLSARRIAPNSFGYASFEASRIIRSVFRRIAVGRWNSAMLARFRELLFNPLVEVVAESDEPRGPLAPGHADVFRPLERDLLLAVEHEEAFFRFRELHFDPARRREHDRSRGRLERCDYGDDDCIDAWVDNRPACGHRVRRGTRRRRQDHSIGPHILRDLAVDADLERADLRDLRRVHDGFVQAVWEAPSIDLHTEPHPLLDSVVPLEHPRKVRVVFGSVDFREKAEGPAVDSEDLGVVELECAQDRPVAADREDEVDLDVPEEMPGVPERFRDLLFEEDLMRRANFLQNPGTEVRGSRDPRVRGEADSHRISSRTCSSPYAITFDRDLGSIGMSRGRPSRSTTFPPASRTTKVPAAMSMARSSWPTSVLWR